MKINIIKILVIVFVIVSVMVGGISYLRKQKIQTVSNPVVVVGFNQDQTGILNEIEKSAKQYSYIKKGNQLLKEGEIEEAIEEFNVALSTAKSSGTKGEAYFYLANAYEKRRNYRKALEYVIITRDQYVNDWAKEPVIERAKYLEYVLKGEYNLAVEHAQKAAEASSKLPNRKGKPREDYVERLNDIKSAKVYIESLKKE